MPFLPKILLEVHCKGTSHFPTIGPSDRTGGPPPSLHPSRLSVFQAVGPRVTSVSRDLTVKPVSSQSFSPELPTASLSRYLRESQLYHRTSDNGNLRSSLGPPATCQRIIPIGCSPFLRWRPAFLPLRLMVSVGRRIAIQVSPWVRTIRPLTIASLSSFL